MRIGVDARLRAYRGGGIAEHVGRLLEGLAALEPPETIVVLEHQRAASASRRGAAGPGRFPTRWLRTPPHFRLEGWTVPLELAGAGLDLLHSPDVVPPRAWRGASVATVHDVAFLRRPERLTADSLRYYRGVHRAVRTADRLIAVSEYTRRELVALCGADPDRVTVVHNAVPARFGAPGDPDADRAAVARLGLREPFVLFVSTIEPRKNVATLLAAHRALLDAGHDVDLALAGADGWKSASVYERARELRLGQRAHFLGFVPDDALAALYRRAAVLAHPALDEGFGLTPLEAMAAGTPAVVAEAGSLPEIVSDAAMQVPAEEPGAWAEALARILDGGELADRLKAAGPRRTAGFTVERMARETLAVYRAAASAHLADRR